MFSNLWMDDLIYATTVHTSHHLCTNGNLDGYVVIIVVLVFGIDPLCYRTLNELLMRGLFDLEIPPEHSNCWMPRLTRYTTTVGTELFSFVESLWETTKKDWKAQNDHTRKICKLECKTLVQGCALEDQDDMICKLSGIIEKQEKALEVLNAKIIHVETVNDGSRERLNNYSYRLGVLELPQQVEELGLNPFVFDLIHPHFRPLMFCLLWDGLPFLLHLVPPLGIIQKAVWRGRTPVQVVSVLAVVVIKEVLIVVIVTVMLIVMPEGSIVGPPVLWRCSMPTH